MDPLVWNDGEGSTAGQNQRYNGPETVELSREDTPTDGLHMLAVLLSRIVRIHGTQRVQLLKNKYYNFHIYTYTIALFYIHYFRTYATKQKVD